MKDSTVILIAEDDAGHFELIKRNLRRWCADKEFIHFKNGKEILDFLFRKGDGPKIENGRSYLLLLDIRMPVIDGYEVLRQIKEDKSLRKIPVIILTTMDDKTTIDQCYKLGCSFYVVKPADYRRFMDVVESLGAFLSLEELKIPKINGK